MLDRALALRGRGPYVVQGAIASLHADERAAGGEIAALFGELAGLTDSPVVELNRAIAVAEQHGPEAAGSRSLMALRWGIFAICTPREASSCGGSVGHGGPRCLRRALELVHNDESAACSSNVWRNSR